MVRKFSQTFLLIVTYIMLMFTLTSCSDTSSEDSSYEYNPAWVTITVPSSNPYTIDKEFIHLTGSAFISDGWSRCCSGSPTDTGVTVTWRNETTGANAPATQYISYGSFLGTPYISSHSWAADIQLNMGSNTIKVTASDPEYSDTENITVIREADTTPPTVIYTRPNDQANYISINTAISASFNESINCDSVQTDTMVIKDNNDIPVTGTFTCSSLVIRFTPLENLDYNTLYTVTIKAGIKDLVGHIMATDYHWSFTTQSAPSGTPDTTPPSVSWIEPEDGSICITTDQMIWIGVSEPLDPITVNSTTFTIKGPDNLPVNSKITYDVDLYGLIVYVQPYLGLALNTTYVATVSHLVSDVSGNYIPQDYTWSFTTQPGIEGNWSDTSMINVPEKRDRNSLVWTGEDVIIWGGSLQYQTGGVYNLATDTWASTATINAPSVRYDHSGIWTGTEMIVWGGFDGYPLASGGRYNLKNNRWSSTSIVNVPAARNGHAAVWTGEEMIVWGGQHFSNRLNTGGRYNPVNDSWQVMSTLNAPASYYGSSVIWTGSEMIIWGGSFSQGSGGKYNPTTDTWTSISTINAPSARSGHSAVWSGQEMIIWGGNYSLDTGGIYNPETDTWRLMSTECTPKGRAYHSVVWTGEEMIIWGGYPDLNSGGIYNPDTDSWLAISGQFAPLPRQYHKAVWSGKEMIIWGGKSDGISTNTGGIFTP